MLRNEICEFFYQEDGVGVIEIVLIFYGGSDWTGDYFQIPDYGAVK